MNTLPDEPTEEISDLLAGYALGALSPDEKDFIERNLPRRPAWQRELEQYQSVADALPYAVEGQAVPVRIRASLLAKIDTIESDIPLAANAPEAQAPSPAKTRPVEPSRLWVWLRRAPRVAWAAALPSTVVIIVFVMYMVIMQDKINDQQIELASYQQDQTDTISVLTSDAIDQRVVELVESNEAPLARGRLFIDSQANSAVLVARDMPDLEEHEGYVVWMLTDVNADEYVPIGILEMNDRGTGRLTIAPPDPFGQYVAISITREADPESADVPSGPEVMSGGL